MQNHSWKVYWFESSPFQLRQSSKLWGALKELCSSQTLLRKGSRWIGQTCLQRNFLCFIYQVRNPATWVWKGKNPLWVRPLKLAKRHYKRSLRAICNLLETIWFSRRSGRCDFKWKKAKNWGINSERAFKLWYVVWLLHTRGAVEK